MNEKFMTKKYTLMLVTTLCMVVGAFSQTNSFKSVSSHLQDISVTIRSDSSEESFNRNGGNSAEGSGVIFTRTNKSGETINLVWTAGHVVSNLRSSREVISPDGTKRTIVEFRDAKIIKELVENGRTVGTLQISAEVVRYSDPDAGEDLALLKVRKKDFINSGVIFYTNSEIPELGTPLYHVGSLLGEQGANSMTSGIYSQRGRLINKTTFDQTTVAAFPGSSGGGVFLTDGRYVGMLVRGAGETFNLIVPIRRIIDWSKSAKINWAIDPTVPMPSDEELKNLPIEDIGKEFKDFSKAIGGKTYIRLLNPDVKTTTDNQSSETHK